MTTSRAFARVARTVEQRRRQQGRHTRPTAGSPAGLATAAGRAAGGRAAGGHGVTKGGRGDAARVVVVGGGYAGLGALRYLEARLPAGAADLELVAPADHMLYTSLLPQVSAGDVEPRHLAVSVRQALSRTVLRLGNAVDVDLDAKRLAVLGHDGSRSELGWDVLVLAPGSVTRTFDIPGLAYHGLGMKTLAEAVYLRDHVLRQLEYADACSDPARRRAHCTFVVVGAGYTGTEVAAQMRRFTVRAVENFPRLHVDDLRWVLLDLAGRVLPELAEPLGNGAAKVLRERGAEVRLGTSVTEVRPDAVTLTDNETIACRTLVWCAGVSADPLMATLGAETVDGRLVVDTHLRVPGVAGVFALGDGAAVPDVTKGGAAAGQTAQHATRQASLAGRNVAAFLGYGRPAPYRHRDLGFVVDLGGADAVANPLGIPLRGWPAAAVTRAYHLYALTGTTNRVRVAADWLLAAAAPDQLVQLGFLPPNPAARAVPEPSTPTTDPW